VCYAPGGRQDQAVVPLHSQHSSPTTHVLHASVKFQPVCFPEKEDGELFTVEFLLLGDQPPQPSQLFFAEFTSTIALITLLDFPFYEFLHYCFWCVPKKIAYASIFLHISPTGVADDRLSEVISRYDMNGCTIKISILRVLLIAAYWNSRFKVSPEILVSLSERYQLRSALCSG
jgi:hypothetical protein